MTGKVVLDAERCKARACTAMEVESFSNTAGAEWQVLTFASGDSRRAETWVRVRGGWEMTHDRSWIERWSA